MHNLQDIVAPVLGVNTTLSVFIGPDFVNVLKMLYALYVVCFFF